MRKSKKKITAGCLFSGMGGFCQAFKNNGQIQTLWANELDERAADTFKSNFHGVRLIPGSIKEVHVETHSMEPVDILGAGFPCQSFSQAGRRKGFDDDRGQLFFEIIRLLREFDNQRPAILLLENVPHLIHGDGGQWMAKIAREIRRAGYWFDNNSFRVLNTAEISEIPQRRERLFLVAMSTDAFDINDFKFPDPILKSEKLSSFLRRKTKPHQENCYLPTDNRYVKMINEYIEKGDPKGIYQLRKYFVRECGQVCPTLTANMGAGGHNVPFIRDRWGIRKLTVDECLRLQGFPEDFSFPESVPTHRKYVQIGNAVSVPVVESLARESVHQIQSVNGGCA